MNKGKKRCGGCKWFFGKLENTSNGLCEATDTKTNVDNTYAKECPHFKRKSYVRDKRISITNVDY